MSRKLKSEIAREAGIPVTEFKATHLKPEECKGAVNYIATSTRRGDRDVVQCNGLEISRDRNKPWRGWRWEPSGTPVHPRHRKDSLVAARHYLAVLANSGESWVESQRALLKEARSADEWLGWMAAHPDNGTARPPKVERGVRELRAQILALLADEDLDNEEFRDRLANLCEPER